MRLLLDATYAASPGLRVLGRGLHHGLAETRPDDASLVVLSPDPAPQLGPGVTWHTVERPPGLLAKQSWNHVELGQLAARERADVVYSVVGQVSPLLTRRICTVASVNNMEPFTPALWALRSRRQVLRLKLLRRVYAGSVRRADRLVMHSQHGLNMLEGAVGSLAHKADVIHSGVALDVKDKPVGEHPRGGEPYFFYLSAMYPYKNHLPLLDAYAQTLQEHPDMPELVFAGFNLGDDYVRRVQERLAAPDLQGKASYLGILDRDDIPGLLHWAECNIFASTCETNSLVQSEILGLGGALACSDVPPMPEVAGDAAALFDPTSTADMARVLTELATSPQRLQDLRAAARRRADELSWAACGETIWRSAAMALQARRARGGRA